MSFVQFWQQDVQLRLAMIQRRARPDTHRFIAHRHAFHEFGFVLRGHCHWLLGRTRHRLTAGDFILVPAGRTHRELIPTGHHAQLAWIGFQFDVPAAALPDWSQRAIAGGTWATDLARRVETAYLENQSAEPGASARVAHALAEILILACRATQPPAAAVRPVGPAQEVARSAARYLTDNLARPLSVSAVARYHSLGAAHFSVVFRRHHGVTPRDFLQHARLDRARELLATGDMRIKEIAATCGYTDAAHFCRRFKTATAQTPRQYRLEHRPTP